MGCQALQGLYFPWEKEAPFATDFAGILTKQTLYMHTKIGNTLKVVGNPKMHNMASRIMYVMSALIKMILYPVNTTK